MNTTKNLIRSITDSLESIRYAVAIKRQESKEDCTEDILNLAKSLQTASDAIDYLRVYPINSNDDLITFADKFCTMPVIEVAIEQAFGTCWRDDFRHVSKINNVNYSL